MITIPSEAKCTKSLLHDYNVKVETDDAYVELCSFCNDKQIFKKAEKQRIDNNKYYRAHLRDFLQPRGSMLGLFEEVYGTKTLDRLKKDSKTKGDADNRLEQAKQDIKDELKFLNNHPSKDI